MIRFTIRDLLWLTVVVALGMGWLVDRSRLDARIYRQERDLADYRAALQEAHFYSGQFTPEPRGSFPLPKKTAPAKKLPGD